MDDSFGSRLAISSTLSICSHMAPRAVTFGWEPIRSRS